MLLCSGASDLTVPCWYCGREFETKKALNAHLQFCSERKKQRDRWTRFPVGRETLCVISRSKRPVEILSAQHGLYTKGRISKATFVGMVEAMRLLDVVEVAVE